MTYHVCNEHKGTTGAVVPNLYAGGKVVRRIRDSCPLACSDTLGCGLWLVEAMRMASDGRDPRILRLATQTGGTD